MSDGRRGARSGRGRWKRPWDVRHGALAALLFLGACSSDPYSGPWSSTVTGSCRDGTGRSQCPSGESCFILPFADRSLRRVCRKSCVPGAVSGCSGGQVCRPTLAGDRGYCIVRCAEDANCADGFQCNAATGLCECSNTTSCTTVFGAGTACLRGLCRTACARTDQCACGTTCQGGFCLPGCADDSECCADSRCEAGRCTAVTQTAAPFGRCLDNDHCPPGTYCASEFSRGACVPIVSSLPCTSQSCAAGSACTRLLIEGRSENFVACYAQCGSQSDCQPNAVCAPDVATPTRTLCEPRCADDSACGAERRCDLSSGVCRCASDAFCTRTVGPSARCDEARGVCACTPQCFGRNCGSDGCGGTCGACVAGASCGDDGRCYVPFCGEGGTVPCGDGYCPRSSTCTSDRQHCTCIGGLRAFTCAGELCSGDACANDSWHCR